MNLILRNKIILMTALILVVGTWLIAVITNLIFQGEVLEKIAATLFACASLIVCAGMIWWFGSSLLQLFKKDENNEYQKDVRGVEHTYVPSHKNYKEITTSKHKFIVLQTSNFGKLELFEPEPEIFGHLSKKGVRPNGYV